LVARNVSSYVLPDTWREYEESDREVIGIISSFVLICGVVRTIATPLVH
jgi:hypothetical protein